MKSKTVLATGSLSVVLATLLLLTPKSQAASPTPAQLTNATGDSRYFLGFSNDLVRYGPGTVDSAALGAGPGPWNLVSSGENGGPAQGFILSVQNLGDRTAEVFVLNALQFTVAGGQSMASHVIASNNAPVAIRFVGAGTRGKVIWAGR